MLVLGVRALLDRGLGPPGANLTARCFCMYFASVLRDRERIRERIRERMRERIRERIREKIRERK